MTGHLPRLPGLVAAAAASSVLAVLVPLVAVERGLDVRRKGAFITVIKDALMLPLLVDLEGLRPVAGELTLVAGVGV